jgi:hypothetical protein
MGSISGSETFTFSSGSWSISGASRSTEDAISSHASHMATVMGSIHMAMSSMGSVSASNNDHGS